MRSMEWKPLTGKTLHGSVCLWLVLNKSTVSCTQRSTYSQILYCVLERWTRTLNQILHGKTDRRGSKVHQNTELMVSQWNSSGIFPGFTTVQLSHKVQELLSRLSVTPEKFTRRIIFMSMFNDITWGSWDNKKECEANAQLVSHYAKKFGAGQWSFLGPGSEKKWYSISAESPQEEWDNMAERMLLEFGESGHPVFRSTSPQPRGVLTSKGGGKLSIHYCADFETVETVFRTIISVNQLSLYGAVTKMCEEYESCHDRSGRPVVREQSSPSFVPSVIKTNTPLNDDAAKEEHPLQRYRERIEKLSQQDRLSKFCTEAGFLTTVEVGQYSTTKDTEEFSQFTDPVALSWVHLAKRRRFTRTTRLDQREH